MEKGQLTMFKTDDTRTSNIIEALSEAQMDVHFLSVMRVKAIAERMERAVEDSEQDEFYWMTAEDVDKWIRDLDNVKSFFNGSDDYGKLTKAIEDFEGEDN